MTTVTKPTATEEDQADKTKEILRRAVAETNYRNGLGPKPKKSNASSTWAALASKMNRRNGFED